MLLLLRKQGKPVPALDSEPEISVIVGWYISAYNRLAMTRREAGIPLSEMKSYIELFGNIGTIDEFVDIIQKVDAMVLAKAIGERANG
jgi:hypothetical protein